MPHQILNDGKRCRLHISISPVDPAVGGTKRSAQQPIPGLGHQFPAAGLRLEAVPTLDILLHLLAKILPNHRNLSKCHCRVRVILHLLQHAREHVEGVIARVRYQKRKVDQVVRVGEVAEMREEHGEVRGGISQRREHEDAFPAFPALLCSLHFRQIIVPDGL